jgi:hypothetical protein
MQISLKSPNDNVLNSSKMSKSTFRQKSKKFQGFEGIFFD